MLTNLATLDHSLIAKPRTRILAMQEIETALRDAGAQSYLIAGTTLSIVRGMPAMLLTLAAAGVNVMAFPPS